MDPELSTWYHERRERIVRGSWERAFFGSLLVVLALTIMVLIGMGLANPNSRPVVLIFAGFGAFVVCARYAIIWYMTRKLKLEFAKKAMTQ